MKSLFWILASAILAFTTPAQTADARQLGDRPCPTIEVSMVADQPGDGARTFQTTAGQTVTLTATPLLTVDDFTDANVTLTEGQIVLNVTMTTESAERVQKFSASHVGHRMAFVVNNRVINTPKILDPITGRGFLLAPFVQAQADDLAALINGVEQPCKRR
jgi:preprotein translocase subunit SecD